MPRQTSRSSSRSRGHNFTTERPHPSNNSPTQPTSNNVRNFMSTMPPLRPPTSSSSTGNPRHTNQTPSNARNNAPNQPPQYSNAGNPRSSSQIPQYSNMSNLGNSVLPNVTRRPANRTQGITTFNVSAHTPNAGGSRAPRIPQNFQAPVVPPRRVVRFQTTHSTSEASHEDNGDDEDDEDEDEEDEYRTNGNTWGVYDPSTGSVTWYSTYEDARGHQMREHQCQMRRYHHQMHAHYHYWI